MLKKGTIPVVDEYLIRAIKYALDQMGINSSNLGQKKRRTSLDYSYPYIPDEQHEENRYNGYFTVVPEEKDENGNITRIKVINGINPLSDVCGLSDLYKDNGIIPVASFDVPSPGEVAFVLERVDFTAKNKLVFCSPDAKTLGYENFVSIAYCSGGEISQMWTSGAVYWAERFFI